MSVLLIDNYDSFAHNLARYIREIGAAVEVLRNDQLTLAEIADLAPSHIVISPGPCTPDRSGVSLAAVRHFAGRIPVLGVCLGHQCIAQAFGGRIVRATKAMHGKTSPVDHDGSGLFAGIPSPLRVTRYHSLIADRQSLPGSLMVTATSDDGVVMALVHKALPVAGVQFHPEAVLTEHGHRLLKNFFDGAAWQRST